VDDDLGMRDTWRDCNPLKAFFSLGLGFSVAHLKIGSSYKRWRQNGFDARRASDGRNFSPRGAKYVNAVLLGPGS
jgi:hypothetical protein